MMNKLNVLVFLSLLAPAAVLAADSDGDGVQDAADQFPCDPAFAGVAFAPGDGQHAVLLFEDQWPKVGDADFNDAVITYNYVFQLDASGKVAAMTATFNAAALGGLFDNGLGLHLPVPASVVSSVSRRIGAGSTQTLTPEADADLTVRISPNLRELHGDQSGQINAIDGASSQGQALEVKIAFATPVTIDVAAVPFDVYLFGVADPTHEIHRTMYAGTANMNVSLFGTHSDASGPGRYFTDGRGLPFVLNVPTFNNYPKEGVDISLLFPNILSFASSAGNQDQDFYTSNIVSAHAYAGSPAVTPAFVSQLAAADTSCQPLGQDPASAGLTCRTLRNGGATADGMYWVDPDGAAGAAPFQAYCDMTTAGGGWTRVFQIDLGSSCNVPGSATAQNPALNGQGCAKYADSVINQLAQEKIFFSRVASHPPLFTKYTGSISATVDMAPGMVRSSADYASLTTQPADFPIGYTAWCFFHQENWYTADRCLGAPGGSYRLSMEYVGCANRSATSWKYACHQANCFSACQSETVGHTEVYIK